MYDSGCSFFSLMTSHTHFLPNFYLLIPPAHTSHLASTLPLLSQLKQQQPNILTGNNSSDKTAVDFVHIAMQNHYDILGVSNTATHDEIKVRFAAIWLGHSHNTISNTTSFLIYCALMIPNDLLPSTYIVYLLSRLLIENVRIFHAYICYILYILLRIHKK